MSGTCLSVSDESPNRNIASAFVEYESDTEYDLSITLAPLSKNACQLTLLGILYFDKFASVYLKTKEKIMGRVDEILAKQKALDEELKLALQEERDAVLVDIKAKIKQFDFKASDFKGYFKSRVTQKQVDEFLAKKAADAKKNK